MRLPLILVIGLLGSACSSGGGGKGDDSDGGGSGGDDTGPGSLPPTTAFAATDLSWDVPDDEMGGAGLYTLAQAYYEDGFWTVFDIDGDSKPDLVMTAPADPSGTAVYGYGGDAYWLVYKNNGGGFDASPTQWDVPDENMGGYGFFTTAESYYEEGFWSTFDIDGDSKPDLVVTAPADPDGTAVFGNRGDTYWQVYRNNGSGFDASPTTWDVPDESMGGYGFFTTSEAYYEEGFWSTVDIDGDARADLVVTAPADPDGTAVFGNGGNAYWQVYRNTGSGFDPSPTQWDVPDESMGGYGLYTTAQSYYEEGFWNVFDIDGQAGPDLVMTAPANPDGTAVYGFGGDAYWLVYKNNGAGFDASPTQWDVPDDEMGDAGLYMTAQSYYEQGFWSTFDLNRDALPDLVMTAPANPDGTAVYGYGGNAYWLAYLNNGGAFDASPVQWDVPDETMGGAGLYVVGQGYYDEGFWTTMDLDGDGGVDLVMTAPANPDGTAVYGYGGDAYWRVWTGE